MLSARLRHTRHLFLLALLCAVALLAISATTNSSATNPLGTTTAAASSCPGDWTGYWTWNAQTWSWSWTWVWVPCGGGYSTS